MAALGELKILPPSRTTGDGYKLEGEGYDFEKLAKHSVEECNKTLKNLCKEHNLKITEKKRPIKAIRALGKRIAVNVKNKNAKTRGIVRSKCYTVTLDGCVEEEKVTFIILVYILTHYKLCYKKYRLANLGVLSKAF